MATEHLTWTLLLLAVVLCKTWNVEYQQQRICAVKGSSVIIHCSFYPPDNLRVEKVMWGHVNPHRSKGRFISGSNFRKVASRFQYIGDKQHDCSLKINQVERKDAGKYNVRFNKKTGPWPGNFSQTLKVVDLKVSVWKPNGNGATKEGDSVNLTCINGCDDGDLSSAFSWFKNGEHINEGAVLYLSNMSSANSGNYACSLKTHTETTSAGVNIDVEHGPKNTSVSVRPSIEVAAGSNFTLICSSRANPPVENYTWFKKDDDDDDIIMDVGHQPVFISGDGGRYLCSATNKHGSQNSSDVTVKIKAYWATFTRDVLLISTAAALLIVTTVIAVRRFKRKRKWAPNTDCGEDIQNADYVNWLICDNIQSQGANQCEGGTTEVVYATIDFNYSRKSNRERQMNDDEEVIYSTVCRIQPLSPSYSEPS